LGFGRDTCRTRTHDHLGLLMSRLICHSESRSTQNNRQPICFPRAPTMLPPASGEARLLFTPLSSRPPITSLYSPSSSWSRYGPRAYHPTSMYNAHKRRPIPWTECIVLCTCRTQYISGSGPRAVRGRIPWKILPANNILLNHPWHRFARERRWAPECDVALV